MVLLTQMAVRTNIIFLLVAIFFLDLVVSGGQAGEQVLTVNWYLVFWRFSSGFLMVF